MKLLLTLTLIAGTAVTLFAQGSAAPAGTPIPLPPGPLFKPFPSQIRWMITRKGAQPGPQAPASTASGPATSADSVASQTQGSTKESASQFDTKIIGEKVGDVTHLITFFSNGTKQEVWKNGPQQALLSSGWKQPIVGRASQDANEELDWISPANFAGIQKFGGRDCLVFRDKVLPQVYRIRPELLRQPEAAQTARDRLDEERIKKIFGTQETPVINPENLKMVAVACIDLESRLPMALQMDNVVTTYKYEALPLDYPLVIPAEFASAMQACAQQMQASIRKPALP